MQNGEIYLPLLWSDINQIKIVFQSDVLIAESDLRLTGVEVADYVIPKGSVAINGISLTVASVADSEFSVAFIPTTLARTNIGDLKLGDRVNIESDILARTVIHALRRSDGAKGPIGADLLNDGGGMTEAKLREHGYL